MSVDSERLLDDTGWQIIEAWQADGRPAVSLVLSCPVPPRGIRQELGDPARRLHREAARSTP